MGLFKTAVMLNYNFRKLEEKNYVNQWEELLILSMLRKQKFFKSVINNSTVDLYHRCRGKYRFIISSGNFL